LTQIGPAPFGVRPEIMPRVRRSGKRYSDGLHYGTHTMMWDNRSIVARMDQDGFAVIPDFLPPQLVSESRQFVLSHLRRHSGEYFTYMGNAAVAGSVLAGIGMSCGLRDILSGVYETGIGKAAPDGDVYQVLRVVAGKTGINQAYRFHFDAYV